MSPKKNAEESEQHEDSEGREPEVASEGETHPASAEDRPSEADAHSSKLESQKTEPQPRPDTKPAARGKAKAEPEPEPEPKPVARSETERGIRDVMRFDPKIRKPRR